MKFKNIYPIKSKDISFFKKLCRPESYFFSDSKAFVNSYVLDKDGLGFCFNDGKTIFFLNRFSDEIYFFCCPKGSDWEEKMISSISELRNKRGKKMKRVWLLELPEPLDENYLNKEFGFIKSVVNKRYISYIPDFRDINQLLKRKEMKRLRKKWNNFFNKLNKKRETKISFEPLTKKNYKDSLKILNRWRLHKGNKRFADNEIVNKEHIFKKDLRMIEDLLKNPNLYESLILYYGDIPSGINVAFKNCKNKNLSSSIFCVSKNIPGMSEALKLSFFERLAKKNYQYCNWGNNCLPSINTYKQKFKQNLFEESYEYVLNFKDK